MHKKLFLIFSFLFASSVVFSQDFQVAKYGSDFLRIGTGARALAMGGAYTGISNDVSSIYWNPSGLGNIKSIEAQYMHSERFGGIVGYDYAAIGIPITSNDAVISLGVIRQGVDGIPNTLNAYDEVRGQPLPNSTSLISRFSTYDLAVLVGYGKKIDDISSWGINFKILNSKLGSFAQAWGYSLDFGIQQTYENFAWGIMLQDVTTLFKFWETNKTALSQLESFDDVIPTGQNEQVLPTVRLGYGHFFRFGKDFQLITSFDTDIRFEGIETYALNTGSISYEPKIGSELNYKSLIFLRAGLTDVLYDDNMNLNLNPTVGIGIAFKQIEIDYGLASISGMTSEFGNTHRISIKIRLKPI